MTTTIQNLDDLQDRRIMMDRDVPPYGYAFVILVGLFMIFLLVWSTRTNRIYVSQNSGTVQASNKTYIMSSYSGTLTELYISEGSYVNEGDLVAHIKSTDLDMQQDNLESQLKIYQTQVDQYNKLLQCIQDDTNYFSETSVEDQPYYYQYETYKSQVEQKTFDASAYQAAGYTDAQIKTMMEQNQSEIQALYYSTMQSISQSITSAQSNSASYYKMTIKPDSTYVVSRSGDKVDLSNGMSVTARVEYDQVTYFEYAMEALGVLFR